MVAQLKSSAPPEAETTAEGMAVAEGKVRHATRWRRGARAEFQVSLAINWFVVRVQIQNKIFFSSDSFFNHSPHIHADPYNFPSPLDMAFIAPKSPEMFFPNRFV